MGMDADVIAIGKFSKSIISCLDYPPDYFDFTPEGGEVITSLFHCRTTETSNRLAEYLGINPWKFEQCHFDANRVDLNNLIELFGMDEVTDFAALRNAGFNFYYRPNG